MKEINAKGTSATVELGDILRELREKRKMTIAKLAEEVEVSSSHISQIERNLSSPSITMLKKIAQVLEVPITYFFEESNNRSTKIIRKNERKKLILPDSKVVYHILSPAVVTRFQLLCTYIEVGGQIAEKPLGHPGDECIFIMQGKVKIIVNAEEYILYEGDSFYYPEYTPHNVINIGDVTAIVLSVISPPGF